MSDVNVNNVDLVGLGVVKVEGEPGVRVRIDWV
jgi:hypothetical protein